MLFPFFGLSRLAAQQPGVEKVPVPSPPLVNQAPDFSSWVVRYPSASPGAGTARSRANARKIKEVDVTKTDDLRREVTVYTDGTAGEFWRYGGLEIFLDPIGKYVNIMDTAKTQMAAANPTKTDFFDLGWIKAQDFVGNVALGGRDCYYFRRSGAAKSTATGQAVEDKEQVAAGTASLEAWIDVNSRLPLAFKDQSGLRQYEFGAAPSARLTLPANMQKELDRYQAATHDGDKYALPPRR